MAINNDQLETWANAPGSAKPQFTHEQIRKALSQSAALKSRDYEVFLQGSYANSTNVKIDSDIDVVVQLNSDFSLHSSTARKLIREGMLHGRDLKRQDGSTYCTIYLTAENKEFLKKYPKTSKIKMTFVDPQGK